MFELIHGETVLVIVAEGKNVFTSTGDLRKLILTMTLREVK